MRTPAAPRRGGGGGGGGGIGWNSAKGHDHERQPKSWLDKSYWLELGTGRSWAGRDRKRRDVGGGVGGGKRVQTGEALPLLGTGHFEV